ncbi:MAG: hypothetical protein ACLVIY_05080 [Anaerobutyricum soehngenii]
MNFCDWERKDLPRRVYRSQKLYVTDTTMRDGQQSLLATRMRTKEVCRCGIERQTLYYAGCIFSGSLGRGNL